MKFYIVDCFAEEKYQGNQLGVFIPDRPLSDMEMQRIAREVNFSEVTFILSGQQENSGFNVKIFTPYAELPFAGHPVLGTAYVIEKYLLKNPEGQIRLNLACGQIQIQKSGNKYFMIQKQPSFSEMIDKEDTAVALSLPASRIIDNLPVQCVSTGLDAVIVPLKTPADLRACSVNHPSMAQFHSKWHKCNMLVFAVDGDNLKVRVFMDEPGYLEDPATGSANGGLAAYLLRHDVFQTSTIDYTVHQGSEIGRPSTLLIKAACMNETYSIRVGGNVIPVAAGNWF